MRKVQFVAVILTLALAIPLTALALVLAAYATEHMISISTAIVTLSRETTVGARGWVQELSARWPEVAGMIVGQIVILLTLYLARRNGMAEEKENA